MLGVLAAQKTQIVYVGDRHQQIYEWRGAINAMENITGCREAYLTQSFRFGQEIARVASSVLAALGEPPLHHWQSECESSIGSIEKPAAVLAWTNAGVEQTPHVVGGVKELQRLLEDVVALNGGQPGICPEFFGFADWAEVLKFVGEEEGESLRMFVQVVEHLVCGGTLSVAASKRSWAQ